MTPTARPLPVPRPLPVARPLLAALALVAPALLSPALLVPALAADAPRRAPLPSAPLLAPLPERPFVSEVRLGGFAHDPFSPEKGSGDVNAEVLFRKPVLFTDPLWQALTPRFHLGGTVNTAGKTSQAYAGFTWTYDLSFAPQVFVEASFGGVVHNGETGRFVPVNRNNLGCSPMFRESASIGYRFTANWSLMATVDHISNAGLCDGNRGLTNVGARLGYSF